jgi:hypothetical protein
MKRQIFLAAIAAAIAACQRPVGEAVPGQIMEQLMCFDSSAFLATYRRAPTPSVPDSGANLIVHIPGGHHSDLNLRPQVTLWAQNWGGGGPADSLGFLSYRDKPGGLYRLAFRANAHQDRPDSYIVALRDRYEDTVVINMSRRCTLTRETR